MENREWGIFESDNNELPRLALSIPDSQLPVLYSQLSTKESLNTYGTHSSRANKQPQKKTNGGAGVGAAKNF